jgi:ATP-binding cassette subfamily C protein
MPADAADSRGWPGAFRLLAASVSRRQLARLLALATLGSVTEGLGLLLLAPILAVISGQATHDPIISAYFRAGLPRSLIVLLAGFVVLVALRTLVVQARLLAETRLQLRVTNLLRNAMFSGLANASWRHLSGLHPSNELAVLMGGIDRVGLGLQQLLALTAAALTLAVMLAAAFVIAPLPSLALGLGGALVLTVYARLRRHAARDGADFHNVYGWAFVFFSERLAALRLIKSFDAVEREGAQARRLLDELAQARLRFQRGSANGQISLHLGAALLLALAVGLGVNGLRMTPVTLVPLVVLVARSVPLFGAIQLAWQNWAHARPALDELARTMRQLESFAEPRASTGEWAGAGRTVAVPEIALEDVTVRFASRDKPSLCNLDLRFAPGSATLLAGPSGSGKSTLADVAAGLLIPDKGAVLIDGVPLSDFGLAKWRAAVAYVQQDPVLFSGSIRANLLWAAPGADEVRLWRAIDAAAASFVRTLPAGLDTEIGDSGHQLSGGERQRIALARALLRRPRLLILDEAASALDAATERAIIPALEALKGSMTMLIIGHGGRFSGLCERRVTLENGRVSAVREPERQVS